jgi:YD repeat-containing protein
MAGEVYTFNSDGNQVKDTSANGEAITYSYNSNGTLKSAADTQDRVTTFTNYSGKSVGTITDPTGRMVNYNYNSGGQLTGVTDAGGNKWQFQYYDGRGNLNQITDPRGYTTTLKYDDSNRVTSITYDDYTSTKATYTYSYNGDNTVVTDPLGHQTTYNYDSQGRVTNIVDAVGASHGSSWDANNNLTSTTSPNSEVTKLSYDKLNNLKSVQNPSLANGSAGAKTSMTYGSSSHPYKATNSTDGQGNQIAYSYDTNGNLMSAVGNAGGGSGMAMHSETFQGDPDGNGGKVDCGAQSGQVCSSTDANGNKVSYDYDSKGNITSINNPGPVGKKTITYDSLSRPKTITDGNGQTETITYNNLDQPTKLSYSDGVSVTYSYDEGGNLYQRTDGAGQTNYEYNGQDQVTKIAQSGQATLNYTYDLASNLKTEQGPVGTTTYSYDKANQIAGINQSINGANETFVFTGGKPTNIYVPGNITETIGYDKDGRETSIKAVKKWHRPHQLHRQLHQLSWSRHRPTTI